MKSWYASKTLWVNLIAVIAMAVQNHTGFVIDPGTQAGLLGLVNLILRMATHQPVNWTGSRDMEPPQGTGGQAGFADLCLLLGLALFCLALTGCAGLKTKADAVEGKALTVAKRANRISDRLLAGGGPMVVAGICVVQPQDCAAAKIALNLANATHAEITRLIAAAEASHADPDTPRMIQLAQTFEAEIGNINKLVVAYNGQPVDLAEYRATVAELQSAAQ